MSWDRPASESAIRGVALLSIGLALAVVGFLAVGCGSRGTASRGAGLATSGDQAASGTGSGSTDAESPCAAYTNCCLGLAASLESVPGYPAESTDALCEGCRAPNRYADQPGMDVACREALVTLVQGVRALEAVPEFRTPEECR